MTRGSIYKVWTLWCAECHTDVKRLAWDREVAQATCGACGARLLPERPDHRVEGVIPDDIPGGMVMEHVEPGRRVYSRTELKQVLANHRSQMWPHGCQLSERGWTGHTDQHFTKSSGAWADLRTKEERQREMAAFLGLTIEQYVEQFG